MLHSMAIRLIHVHQLETCFCYGVKYQSGVNFRRQTTPSLMAKCLVLLSFFWQHFRDLYLRHAWTDFNQTWSQEPLTHGIYVI